MSHIPITILAYFLNSLAILVDKFMLTKQIPNPFVYVFYFSIFSCLALLLLPITHYPSSSTFILASSSTLLWTTGAYFMFCALKIGQASRIIPIIGTLIPSFLLIYALFGHLITTNELLSIILLLLGLICLTLPDWRGKIDQKELAFIFLSSLFFAVSYVVLRQAYLQANFLTVLVWSRVILIPVVILSLLVPYTRKIIFLKSSNHPVFHLRSKIGLLFLLGGAAGGASELLLTYAISLATPALVNSLQGTQFVFLFLFSLILAKKYPQVFKESLNNFSLVSKLAGILAIGLGLYLLAFLG